MAYYVGKAGTVQYNATTIAVSDWKYEDAAGEVNTTTTASNGYEEVQEGLKKATGSFNYFWTVGTTSQLFHGGDFATNLTFNLDVIGVGPGQSSSSSTAGPAIVFSNVMITSVSVVATMPDAIKLTCNWRTTAAYGIA